MKFVIGIGNPGASYKGSRHNVGFAVVEALREASADTASLWAEEKELEAVVAKLGEDAALVKPLRYVNNTGGTVAAIFEKRQADRRAILIVCDDANLDFGKLRLRDAGSAGGHHGLQSIIEDVGFEEFPRLRVGVRNKNMPKELTSFVLGKFEPDEQKEIEKIVQKAVLVCQSWLEKGFDAAVNQLSRLQSEKPGSAK